MKTIKILALAVALAATTMNAVAQQQKVEKGYGVPVLQKEPEFPGGQDSLAAYLHNNLKYPHELIESMTGGKVVIMFIVDKEGNIVDPIVLKGVSSEINEEALRVVKSMPKWNPGTNGGMPVNKQYILPIDFVPPHI